MRMKLSDGTIRALAPTAKRLTIRDTELVGFVLRLPSKTFAYEYRAAGAGRSVSPITLKIGGWPSLREKDARKIVQGLVVDVARGHDPRRERQARVAKQDVSLKALLADGGPYETALRARGLVNWRVALSSLRRELAPLAGRDPSALTRGDIVQQITALAITKPGAAADLRKFSYGLLEWAVQQGHAANNVLAGWKATKKTRAEKLAKAPTGRALADAEIVSLWQAADTDETCFGALVQLGLLTAMRRGELAGLRWGDVHSDRIVLGAHATKTGEAHSVPLTDLMRSVFAHIPRTTSDLLFASPSGIRLAHWSRLVTRLQRASGVDFTLHDLRRTCRTIMSRLDIPEDHGELAIGHARTDLIARYNKDDSWRHRVAAFDAVSAHIGTLIGSAQDIGKVIALGR